MGMESVKDPGLDCSCVRTMFLLPMWNTLKGTKAGFLRLRLTREGFEKRCESV